MPNLPKSEWDLFLRSPMRLAEGVGLRFDAKGGHCLHDRPTSRSWALETWQNHLLREIDQGAEFRDAVCDVIRAYPEIATRQAILELINGLRRIGFLKIEKPFRKAKRQKENSKVNWAPQSKPFYAVPTHWAAQLAFGAAIAVAGGWTLSQAISEPAPPLFPTPMPPGESAVEETEPVSFAWEESADDKVAVRVWCHGVITDLMVRDGEEVKSGDILARVADPMARATRDDLRTLLGECRMRRDRFYQDGDPVSYLRETKAIARLTRELSQWEQQSDSVPLRAPISGKVRRNWFAESVGDRVSPGDILLAIEVNSEAADLLAIHP